MLRVAYVGNFSRPYTTETHIARTLEHMGASVVRLQEDRVTVDDIEDAAHVQRADLVLYTRTWGKGPGLTDAWRRLETSGIRTASYHLDLYLGLTREVTIVDDPFWTAQYVFTPDGDPGSARRFADLGINHHWLPPAIVEDETYLGQWNHRFAVDVAFVGMGPRYHAEWPHRQDLLAFLTDRYGHRFRRYGPGGEIVRGPHLNDLYASVKVVVGDSLCPGYTHQRYWSDRPYETVGRGGFLIMPHVPGLEAHFTSGEHLIFYEYGDFDYLGNVIDASLDDPAGRDRIRTLGQAHVARHHTYRDRLTEALATMGLEV